MHINTSQTVVVKKYCDLPIGHWQYCDVFVSENSYNNHLMVQNANLVTGEFHSDTEFVGFYDISDHICFSGDGGYSAIRWWYTRVYLIIASCTVITDCNVCCIDAGINFTCAGVCHIVSGVHGIASLPQTHQRSDNDSSRNEDKRSASHAHTNRE